LLQNNRNGWLLQNIQLATLCAQQVQNNTLKNNPVMKRNKNEQRMKKIGATRVWITHHLSKFHAKADTGPDGYGNASLPQ
jgi:hypothetical protein